MGYVIVPPTKAGNGRHQMLERVCLGARTLRAGDGGISRVARLMARVLADEVTDGALGKGTALVLDEGANGFEPLSMRGSKSSKLDFAGKISFAQLTHSHFLYADLSMAQAHMFVPHARHCLAFIHGIEVWEDARPKYLRCARKVDVLIANSLYTRERAHNRHGHFSRAKICWLGTETDEFPTTLASFEGPPTAVIVGRLHAGRDKGHRALIDAWASVASKVPDARLLIIGTGNDERQLKEYASRSKAAEHIHFYGFVADDEMRHIWEQAWVFAMPSRGEGFGLTYIEAMRIGLPVIASVHDAAPEVNLEGITGYNVNLDRPDELKERLIALLGDPAHCARLGLSGQKRWRENFTYSAFRNRFRPILHQFLGGGLNE